MTILAVNPDREALKGLKETLTGLYPDARILCYLGSPRALAAARQCRVDVAFLCTQIEEIGGLDLGRYLKELNPRVNLIYMTTKKADAYDALSLRASGCLLLPVGQDAAKEEMANLRHPLEGPSNYHIFAQTFGNFELFAQGVPVQFKYSKTKEIIALLIYNRGAQTTNGEIIAALWEDEGDPEKKASYLSNLRQDLQNTLSDLDAADILIKQRGSMGIATDRIGCDLYDYLKNKKTSRYRYLGEFMNQYSWAEGLHAELDEISWEDEDQ